MLLKCEALLFIRGSQTQIVYCYLIVNKIQTIVCYVLQCGHCYIITAGESLLCISLLDGAGGICAV
jgi:hypothetical protein